MSFSAIKAGSNIFRLQSAHIQNMSNYPLSTKSSKKSHKNHLLTHSPIMSERSACQKDLNKVLKPEDYGHILLGQRVFIEMYYQGRVVATAYNEYITFMGAQLSKRLNNKVTIFITNIDLREVGPLRERVKRVCPNCRIVNILWFQQCYQEKQKVPFDAYALDIQNLKQIEETKTEKNAIDESQLNDFLGNICEDAEVQYKEFFKNEKKKYFSILPKNHGRNQYEFMQAQEIDLGPNPEKKAKPKNENGKKRRKTMSKQGEHQPQQNQLNGSKRQLKSTGVQARKGMLQDQQQNEQKEDEEHLQQIIRENHHFLHQDQRLSSLQNIMSKYLAAEDKTATNKEAISATIKSKRQNTHIVSSMSENTQTASKSISGQPKTVKQPINSLGQISKKTIYSTFAQGQSQKINPKYRFTFSNIGNKYKDAYTVQQPDHFQLQKIVKIVNDMDQNSLVVLIPSRALQAKINEINAEANHHSSIKVHTLQYKHFQAYSAKAPRQSIVNFLLNTKKASERALFFSLLLQKLPLKVRMVNYRLLEEIIAYNNHVKNLGTKSPIKFQPSRLKFLKEITFTIQKQSVVKKRITFLQSEIAQPIQKKVIQALGGIFIPKEEYLLSADLDLIVTDKYGLKEKGIETVSQESFWKRVIKLQGEVC